ncbi:MAG: hypothetical protein F4X66_13630 [Chloroflexi bacterium]|nr:hypothetical protein [Chloroflexota bacterium]MYE39828.1 hypothetical protein [Chloroflexota bacterium]
MLRSLFGRGKKRREPAGPPPDESIRAARVGDVLMFAGMLLEYEYRHFYIERIHRYVSPSDTWYELLCVDGDTRIWIDWTDGADLFVTMTPDEGPTGLGVTGLSEDDLIQLDEEHSIDNYVEIEGDNYRYRTSSEVTFYRDCRGPGESFYQWDFLNEEGDHTLSITKGEGRPFETVFSEVISPDGITLYKGSRPGS